ncbi:hypothetical protein TSUD_225580 [Trifolium subterraneum]|uniref:Subtilisin-like protease fibronectin type-III domain-containing protein n=1 Tax=Trifolium subterraneum TaxID=3900 RepID=A0A2Z6MR79_TRISU|nr:hypothetical protein TSUD_225580 [Trifolium subterraneum]
MVTQTGVLKVLQDKKYKLLTTRTPEFLGLDRIHVMFPASTSSSRSMEDIIVGVIDSGVWPESKSFDDTGYGPIPTTWKGKCEIGTDFTVSNCNKKLIGARFFLKGYEADKGSPINETKESRSPRDTKGHGTHTASISVGSPVRNASLFGYAAGTARGMAPRARVAIYKVCWEGHACLGSDYLAAIDQAIIDKVNVLSLSLGFTPLDYVEDPLAIGAFAAMEHGILVSCAGGNSGPRASLITNVAPWITTVGAGTLDRDFPAYITLGNSQNYTGISLYNGSSFPDTSMSLIYAGNASIPGEKENARKCVGGSLDKKKVEGKIVMCESGFLTGPEKGNTVKSLGGLGMVLATLDYDEEELLAEPHILPTIVVKFKDGEAIKKYLFSQNPNNSMATVVCERTQFKVEPSPVVAMFSSRGPNSITPQILKPDFIAPGVNILAAFSRKAIFNGGQGTEEIKHTRTLTNVGAEGTYKVSIKSDAAFVKISIEPKVLSFKTKEKKLYTITFSTSGSKPNSSQSFGSLEWSDGNSIVRSPIAFSWK